MHERRNERGVERWYVIVVVPARGSKEALRDERGVMSDSVELYGGGRKAEIEPTECEELDGTRVRVAQSDGGVPWLGARDLSERFGDVVCRQLWEPRAVEWEELGKGCRHACGPVCCNASE